MSEAANVYVWTHAVISPGKYRGVELLDPMVNVHFTLQETVRLFQVAGAMEAPPGRSEGPACLHFVRA